MPIKHITKLSLSDSLVMLTKIRFFSQQTGKIEQG